MQEFARFLDERLCKLRLVLLVLMLSGVLTMFVLTYFTGQARAEMIDHYGTELSIAGLSDIAPGSHNSDCKFNWLSIALFGQHDFNEDWNAKLEGVVGYLKWSEKGDRKDQDTYSIGAQLVFYRHIYKSVSLGLGGGLCTLAETKGLSNLGDSGLYGTITGRLKVEVSKNYGVELAADHISDAISTDDSGKNVLALKFYYTFD